MINILLADKLNPQALELLRAIPEFQFTEKYGLNHSELNDEIQKYDVLIVNNTIKIEDESLIRSEGLKLIISTNLTPPAMNFKLAKDKAVDIKCTKNATSITVAEYTIALMFTLARKLIPAYGDMNSGKYETAGAYRGIELYKKTSGIIGLGKVGKEVARRQIALGMNVIYSDINVSDPEINARRVPLDVLLREADFISIHLPASEKTKHFLTEKHFDMCKKELIFIDVSGRNTIDYAAMLSALQKGRFTSVALDVYSDAEAYPPELLAHERVYAFPNLNSATVEGRDRAALNVLYLLKEYFNV